MYRYDLVFSFAVEVNTLWRGHGNRVAWTCTWVLAWDAKHDTYSREEDMVWMTGPRKFTY